MGDELRRLARERDRANRESEQIVREAARRVAASETKVAALQAGVKPDRADAVAQNVDPADVVDGDGQVRDYRVRAAVDGVLRGLPEWKAEQPATRSGTELRGGRAEPSLGDFRRMGYGQRAELYKSDPDLYRRLADGDRDGR